MAKDRDIMGYCLYCKNAIYFGDAYTKGKDGKLYHPACYNLENTYTDEFGTSNTDQFGEIIDE
jgi:hypothetical protein